MIEKQIRELCSGHKHLDYRQIVNTLGKVLVWAEEGSYSGDTLALVSDEKTGRVGYVEFGWGSCSVCDALAACRGVEDYIKLAQKLYDGIKWFDTLAKAKDWMTAHDWEGTHISERLRARFVGHVLELLDLGNS